MKHQPATRHFTCRACSHRYEYPLKGHPATRYHCEECAVLPEPVRKLAERLQARLRHLESAIKHQGGTPIG